MPCDGRSSGDTTSCCFETCQNEERCQAYSTGQYSEGEHSGKYFCEFFDSDDFEAPVIRFQSGDYVTKYVPEEEREDGEEEDEIQKI